MQFSKLIALAATVAFAVATPIDLLDTLTSPKGEESGSGDKNTNINTGNQNSRNCNIGQNMGQVSCCNSVTPVSAHDAGLLDILGFTTAVGAGLNCVVGSACSQKATCCTGDVNQSSGGSSGLIAVGINPNINICSLNLF